MEEQLSEARLECSRLKTELVTEKSSWEITKSEMTSRLNKVSRFIITIAFKKVHIFNCCAFNKDYKCSSTKYILLFLKIFLLKLKLRIKNN